jgi:hypothetical protein
MAKIAFILLLSGCTVAAPRQDILCHFVISYDGDLTEPLDYYLFQPGVECAY